MTDLRTTLAPMLLALTSTTAVVTGGMLALSDMIFI